MTDETRTVRLVEAGSAAEFAAARILFEEYARQIGTQMGIDLGFQNFAAELDQLPAMYGPPSGCLYLAICADEWVGCCALRRFGEGVCEMKRLYIKPKNRGAKLGHRLAESVVAKARSLGYQRMVLDTAAEMVTAQTLYRSLGFRDTAAYYFNPMEGVSYMELDLNSIRDTARAVPQP